VIIGTHAYADFKGGHVIIRPHAYADFKGVTWSPGNQSEAFSD